MNLSWDWVAFWHFGFFFSLLVPGSLSCMFRHLINAHLLAHNYLESVLYIVHVLKFTKLACACWELPKISLQTHTQGPTYSQLIIQSRRSVPGQLVMPSSSRCGWGLFKLIDAIFTAPKKLSTKKARRRASEQNDKSQKTPNKFLCVFKMQSRSWKAELGRKWGRLITCWLRNSSPPS